MNRKMIEEKDRLLLKKMREALKTKEHLNKEERIREEESEKKPVWQRPGFWGVILCAGFILSGLMIFKKPSSIVASNGSEQGIEAAVEESKAMVATKNPDPDPIAVADTKEMDPVLATHPKETPPSMEIDPTEQTHISSGIQITEIVSCSRITQRQYSAPQKVFSLKKDATAAIWMHVVSDEHPVTLTHVYYVNGSRYCAVTLEMQYKSMRTWSNVTLGHQAHIGEWRVEVITDKGEKLDQITFAVVP